MRGYITSQHQQELFNKKKISNLEKTPKKMYTFDVMYELAVILPERNEK